MDIGVNVKLRTIKFLEENSKRVSSLPWDKQSYFSQNTKSINHKYGVNKLDLIKIKNICSSKDTIKNE